MAGGQEQRLVGGSEAPASVQREMAGQASVGTRDLLWQAEDGLQVRGEWSPRTGWVVQPLTEFSNGGQRMGWKG